HQPCVPRGSTRARSGFKGRERPRRRAQLFRGRSGDLIVLPKPGWMTGAAGSAPTTHGSANPDDQRVPIVLYGSGIKPGKYDEEVTPADIAPTLAEICGITLAQARGSALRSVRQ